MLIKKLYEYPLLGSMLFYIFLFATVTTLLVVSVSSYFDYRQRLNAITAYLDAIKISQLNSLSKDLWALDYDGLEIQMKGSLHHPDIVYQEIVHPDGTIFSVGEKAPAAEQHIVREYNLTFNDYGKWVNLGTFRVYATTTNIKNQLVSELPLVIVSNFLGITFICGFILFLFIALFNRHLIRIADFTKNLDLENLDKSLDLKRKAKKNVYQSDELDRIVTAINEMRLRIKHSIQQKKEAEIILRESEEKYRLIFEHSPLGIVHLDRNGIITASNEKLAELLGSTVEKTLGFDTLKLVKDEKMKSAISSALAGKMGYYTGHYLSVTGNVGRDISAIYSTIYSRDGSISGAIGIFEDITPRIKAEKAKERLEAQLRQVYKMEAIGTLAGGIAHDFNNILTIVIGNTELAQMKIPEENPVKTDLEQVLQASGRAKDLVKQILTFTRMAEKKTKSINILNAVEDSLALLRSTLPTSIKIQKKLDLADGFIVVDPTQFHQLFINLCTNASQAMHEKGTLEIGLTRVNLTDEDLAEQLNKEPGRFIRLSVRDTGEGMNQATIDRIFDPFFTTKMVGHGTGMGLSVVHGIIESHGGLITVESETGRGSTFHVFFPEAKEEPVEKFETVETVPTGNEKILFIDDEIALAQLWGKLIEGLGYEVSTQTSSTAALELFKAQPDEFDLIITDMAMPDMTGKELASEVLKIRPDIPIVLCTGYSTMISKESAREIGIRKFCLKPLDRKQLATIIREALDNNS